ncbi:MAG: sulfotransferase [Planctomycetota bacterium]
MTAPDADIDRAFAEHPPIILVGTQRSGTTYMGDVLGTHPDVAYWVEPRHVWVRGNAYSPDDRLSAENATPAVRARIRKTFYRFMWSAGKTRLAEKTPSNCMRLPFIDAVLPEARILLIVRDGRSVLRSTGEIMRRGMPVARIAQRARQTPLTEWPAEFGALAGAVTSKITRKPLRYWGPKPPGWRDWIGLHRDEMLARQWAGGLTCALDDADILGPDRVLRFKYEDLMRNPAELMPRIADFCRLPDAQPMIDHVVGSADASRIDKWRSELADETLDRVLPIMQPVLERLGYDWASSATEQTP